MYTKKLLCCCSLNYSPTQSNTFTTISQILIIPSQLQPTRTTVSSSSAMSVCIYRYQMTANEVRHTFYNRTLSTRHYQQMESNACLARRACPRKYHAVPSRPTYTATACVSIIYQQQHYKLNFIIYFSLTIDDLQCI